MRENRRRDGSMAALVGALVAGLTDLPGSHPGHHPLVAVAAAAGGGRAVHAWPVLMRSA
jgi:hypothetical protein